MHPTAKPVQNTIDTGPELKFTNARLTSEKHKMLYQLTLAGSKTGVADS
jgi:hypothetical protein